MKNFKTALTAFVITAGAFCSLICMVGMFLLPAEVGSAKLPAGDNVSGIDYAKAPDPISLKILCPEGSGMLLYLNFSAVTAEVYLFENAENLAQADTDYYIEPYVGFAGRLCDRLGGIELGEQGRKELYFGPSLEQYAADRKDKEALKEISSAFFEKFANIHLSSEDLAFIIENGKTDLNFPLCYDMLEYLPQIFANVTFR